MRYQATLWVRAYNAIGIFYEKSFVCLFLDDKADVHAALISSAHAQKYEVHHILRETVQRIQ